MVANKVLVFDAECKFNMTAKMVLNRNVTWLPRPVIYSDWMKFKKSFKKQLGRLNCNIVSIFFLLDQNSKMAVTTELSLTQNPMEHM